MHVQDHPNRCSKLTVQRFAAHTAECSESLEPGGHLYRRIRMHRACSAVVPCIHRSEKVDDLGAANLTHHESVRPHAQRLPDQLPHRHLADAFDVGGACHQPHDVWMRGSEFGCIFDTHDPPSAIDLAE